jgi:geranylgeranyl reductase family protein
LKSFDVIVVGAGTAGCMTSKTAASSGFTVCLIDRKQKKDIGKKVCGDAIGKHHFEALGLENPKGEELRQKVKGGRIYSPDMETIFCIKGKGLKGYIVDRHLFGQRLLGLALDAGVELLEPVQTLEPIIRGGFVVGVVARDIKTGNKLQIKGHVVVDASGFSAILRKKLPPENKVEREIEKKDIMVCYREIRELKKPFDNPEFFDIYLNMKVAPGGYFWIFPAGGMKVNVGLGVNMCDKFPNPKNQLYQHVLSKSLFNDSKLLEGGAWYVPTRRPLDCMVGNGVIVVGDVACQVNPIHGGGIGPSMRGGKLAGKTIIEAMEKEDVSQKALWSYNRIYLAEYGAKQAGLDVFRSFAQELGDDDLNYGMKHRLMTEEDILKTVAGEDVRLNITDKTMRVFRGLRKISLVNKLRKMANLNKEIKALYGDYPVSPEGFVDWKNKVAALMEKD